MFWNIVLTEQIKYIFLELIGNLVTPPSVFLLSEISLLQVFGKMYMYFRNAQFELKLLDHSSDYAKLNITGIGAKILTFTYRINSDAAVCSWN